MINVGKVNLEGKEQAWADCSFFFTYFFVEKFVGEKLQKVLGKVVIRDQTEGFESAEERERRWKKPFAVALL